MRKEPSAAVAAAIKRASVPKGEDKLDRLREAARTIRDAEMELAGMLERTEELKKKIHEMQFSILPDLFIEAGVTSVGIDAEGNMPAAQYLLMPYYKASIGANWSDEDRDAAFDHLESLGLGDIIKTEVKVLMGRGDRAVAKSLEEKLVEMGIPHTTKLDVPWSTLTAVLKEQSESGNLKLDLDKIGGTIGSIVKRKDIKR